MKNTKMFAVGFGSLLVGFFTLAMPMKVVLADAAGDKADYQRKVNQEIDDLKTKINDAKTDYQKDGVKVNERIKNYQDRIAEIKRESDAKMNSADWDKTHQDTDNRISDIRHNFYEWRFNRMINSYEDQINDLRYKSRNEANPDTKRDLDEKITKLEAKNNTAKAKLADLRATNGANWDEIEKDLDARMKEIDQDFDNARHNP